MIVNTEAREQYGSLACYYHINTGVSYLLPCITYIQVTFAVLAFPREHHAMAFGVSAAATGSCVLKVALGRLLGAPGEVFKILDDPLGDRCHISRYVGGV